MCLPSRVFKLLECYVQNFRPENAGQAGPVFTSSKGKALESGGVSKQINALWKRSGVYGDSVPPHKNVGTTVIRKSVTTLVHDQLADKAQHVADLLTHNLETAKQHYRIKNRQQQALKGAAAIDEVMRRKITAWKEGEVHMLCRVFGDVLAKKSVTMDQVREKMPFMNLVKTDKQVYDKLRKLVEQNEQSSSAVEPPVYQETLEDRIHRIVPDEASNVDSGIAFEVSESNHSQDDDPDFVPDDVSVIAPSSSTQRAEKLFTSDETSIMRELFSSVIEVGPITTSRIKPIKSASEEMYPFLKKVTLEQVQNKLKYFKRKERN